MDWVPGSSSLQQVGHDAICWTDPAGRKGFLFLSLDLLLLQSLSVGTLRGALSQLHGPEHMADWWPCSSGLHRGLAHVPPWAREFTAAMTLWLYTPAYQSHLTSAQTAVCHCLATVDQLWSRKPSQLLHQPVGYEHNLSPVKSQPPQTGAPSKFVLPCVFSLSLRYPLEFSLHLYVTPITVE